MSHESLRASWIAEMNDFRTAEQRSEKDLARAYRVYHSADFTLRGCDEAIAVFRSLALDPGATVEDTRAGAIAALRARWDEVRPGLDASNEFHSGFDQALEWAIAVVEGNASKHYNRFHPRRPGGGDQPRLP